MHCWGGITLLVFTIISVSNAYWHKQPDINISSESIRLEDEYKITFTLNTLDSNGTYFTVNRTGNETVQYNQIRIYFPVHDNTSMVTTDLKRHETYFFQIMQVRFRDAYRTSIKVNDSILYRDVHTETRNGIAYWAWSSSPYNTSAKYSDMSYYTKGFSQPCGPNAYSTTREDGSSHCECRHGYRGNGHICYDVNECDENPCHEFASCKNTRGSFECTCHKGYMGNGYHCQEMWLSNSRCGAAHYLDNGMKAQCNPKGNTPCCSAHGFCGQSPKHCECPTCVDHRQECLYNDMDITTETLREEHGFSSWKECESRCKEDKECMAWVWGTETFHHESSRKMCTLKRGDGHKHEIDLHKDIKMRHGMISGLKHCPDDEKRSYMGHMRRNGTQTRRITTCPTPGSCWGNLCTRGITGSTIKKGDFLQSYNDQYTAKMEYDGNFVIYCNKEGQRKPIWSTNTEGDDIYEGLMFQRDGNLVLYAWYKPVPIPVWSSGTSHTEADHLVMRDNGNLVLFGPREITIYWESKSYGMC